MGRFTLVVENECGGNDLTVMHLTDRGEPKASVKNGTV